MFNIQAWTRETHIHTNDQQPVSSNYSTDHWSSQLGMSGQGNEFLVCALLQTPAMLETTESLGLPRRLLRTGETARDQLVIIRPWQKRNKNPSMCLTRLSITLRSNTLLEKNYSQKFEKQNKRKKFDIKTGIKLYWA
eukprot:s1052_g4.t1